MAKSAWDSTPVDLTKAQASTSAWDATPNHAPEVIPPEDPGVGQSLLIGAGRTFDRIGKGFQQLYYGARGDKKNLATLAQDAASDDKAYAGLQSVRPWSTGIGEALPSMVAPGTGGATLGTQMLRMGAAGAIPKWLEYGSLEDRAKAAALNGAAGAAMPALGVAAKTTYAAAEPFLKGGQEAILGRTLNRVAANEGGNVGDAITRLKNAAPVVPGSMPTAAQVTENGGIAALERSARAVNPAAYTARTLEQQFARKQALQGIANTPENLQIAEALRANASTPWYDFAKRGSVDVTPQVANIIDRIPANAQSAAENIARIKGEPIGTLGLTSQQAKPPIFIGQGEVPPVPPTISGNALHYLKLGLDDTIGSAADATSGIGKNQLGALTGLSDSFNGMINSQLPGYQTARTVFSNLSQPINQMQVGQALYNKMVPALADHGALGTETAARYAAALRDAEQVARKATGQTGATLESVLTPEQMNTVNGVAKDLARTANAANLGKDGGSDTVQKLAMQNIAQQSGMPTVMGGLTKLFGSPLDWAYRNVSDEMAQKMARALLNPQEAGMLMTGTQPLLNPAVSQNLGRALMRVGAVPAEAYLSQTPP